MVRILLSLVPSIALHRQQLQKVNEAAVFICDPEAFSFNIVLQHNGIRLCIGLRLLRTRVHHRRTKIRCISVFVNRLIRNGWHIFRKFTQDDLEYICILKDITVRENLFLRVSHVQD